MSSPSSTTPVLLMSDVTINPLSVAANSSLDVTATVTGLRKNYPVEVWAEALEANLVLCNAHCSATDTVKFRLVNVTGLAIDPASQTFRVVQR